MMSGFFSEYKGFWPPERKRSMYLGIILLGLSILVQITLGRYSADQAVSAAPASDIFLNNLPVVNLGFIIVGGAIALWVLAWLLLIRYPQYLIFGTKAIALYIVSRAFFISLTHIGPYPHQFSPGPTNVGYSFYQLFTFQGNYFFSGHTGFPFLMALIFWDSAFLRRLFLFLTVFFGASVLLAHVHYSIDVFAAPFIVYGMFVITAKVFPRDYALLPGRQPVLDERNAE
jgi:PAP2 superfamily C-terminal